MDRNAPIGVFDSGLGGLTVVRRIRELLPNEDIVYLGDTARVPYGTRSARTIVRYALSCGQHLQEHGIKLLVVACNTVSAVALDMLRVELDIPVLGVIEPGARKAADTTKVGRVGVIATAGTVASSAYPRAIAAYDSRVEVFQQPAPLLVPLAEEGWLDGDVPRLVAAKYLAPLLAQKIDTLVLGCTHYPLLAATLEQALTEHGTTASLVDSGFATAEELVSHMHARTLLRTNQSASSLSLHVTDRPQKFQEVAARFLGEDVDSLRVEQIDLRMQKSAST